VFAKHKVVFFHYLLALATYFCSTCNKLFIPVHFSEKYFKVRKNLQIGVVA